MALSHLSSAQIKRLIKLVKEKETLEAKLTSVSSEIDSLEGSSVGRPGGRRRGRPPGSKNAKGGKGRKSARLKEPLLKALKAAGSSGITVKDLAAKLKVKPGNIFSWFYTTGKKIKEIKKVGEARYAISG